MAEGLGLYIHIPFCDSKCPYCDFYSIVSTPEKKKLYIKALIQQMTEYSEQVAGVIDTIYIGGGTPTSVGKARLAELFKAIRKNFRFSGRLEWTMEANPASALFKILKTARKAGVNRLSLGVQSANDNELAALGRIHRYKDAEQSVNAARKAGFDNISLDLMFGIPEQTTKSYMESLNRIIELDPNHISCYGLTLEKGTQFYKNRNALILPDEEQQREMYFTTIKILAEAGYRQYEISNFAKPGYECRHNIRYWNCDEYLGLGPAAHSYFGNKRFSFKKDINLYIDSMKDNLPIVDEIVEIKPNEMLADYIMLRLRLNDGVNANEVSARFGKDFEAIFGEKVNKYIKSGHMQKKSANYSFTPEGFYVSNYILADLLNI